ncbi:hypothetical protein EDB86DRAFT_2889722 [Lactarius hatsudake]|nr:hypothetical protein EDB86DRAFT_2889722 [Lactarius hatsudake]
MDPLYLLQLIRARTDPADGLSQPEQHSWPPLLGSEHGPAQQSNTSSLQSYHTAPYLHASSVSSPQSYYFADSSPSYSTMNSLSSNTSFPYSITSINSRKSHKNVLYPRRTHPLPVAVSSEHFSISTYDLIWQVRSLCTTWLPHGENCFVPTGSMLLQSLGLRGDFSESVPVRVQADEKTRCCAELFMVLAHEVLLRDVISAGALKGPYKLLKATFEDILFKSGAFSPSNTLKSDGTLTLQRFYNVLLALFSVLNAFEGALNTIKVKPVAANLGDRRDHDYRIGMLALLIPAGLTMENYRKKLDQILAQTQAQLNSLGQPEGLGLLPTSTSVIPMTIPAEEAPQAISTIEGGSEAEGEGISANGRARSDSTQSRSSDSGKRSLPRRILRRLTSSIGRKVV